MPPPINSHPFLCLSVAFKSRGNHTKGTDTVRPSSSTTVSASLEQDTSIATASLLATEVGIPSLQEKISILVHEFTNDRQLMTAKTPVRRQIHWIKPELRITSGVRDVNVWRLTVLQTVEEESVSANPEQYRDCLSLHRVESPNSTGQECARASLPGRAVLPGKEILLCTRYVNG